MEAATDTKTSFVLRHILDTMLPIDANVLCDLIETMCGSLILIRKSSSFHNITLPLSWLNSLLHHNKLDLSVKILGINPMVNTLVTCLQQLIKSLHTGQQQLGRQFHYLISFL